MTSQHRPSPSAGAVLLVFLGGVLGVALSAVVRDRLGSASFSFTTQLATVNVLGSLCLGLLVGLLPDSLSRLRLFAGTGFLGSFTSFSAIPLGLFPGLRELFWIGTPDWGEPDGGATVYMSLEQSQQYYYGFGAPSGYGWTMEEPDQSLQSLSGWEQVEIFLHSGWGTLIIPVIALFVGAVMALVGLRFGQALRGRRVDSAERDGQVTKGNSDSSAGNHNQQDQGGQA